MYYIIGLEHYADKALKRPVFHLSKVFLFCFVCFLGPYLRHMEVPRLGAESAVAASLRHSHSNSHPNHICDLYRSSEQRWNLNPLSKVRD